MHFLNLGYDFLELLPVRQQAHLSGRFGCISSVLDIALSGLIGRIWVGASLCLTPLLL